MTYTYHASVWLALGVVSVKLHWFWPAGLFFCFCALCIWGALGEKTGEPDSKC